MKIGIDMMGGDFAPLEAVHGIRQYAGEGGTAHLVLVGDEGQVAPLLPGVPGSYEIVHAPETIGMHEHPTRALKEKPRSSISVGFHLLATGAMLVGSLYSLKPLEGILRPTISTIIPKEGGGTGLLLDVGLNSDCKPEHLNQFATMGTVYAREVLGIATPRVALLNIGEEEGKGNLLAQAAYPLLRENASIHFIGNAEGRDILLDKADVLICDGFTGNIILKLAESLHGIAARNASDNPYFERFNFEEYGGTPVLGIAKPVIIGHGISKGRAFKNMILLAQKMIYTEVMQKMKV
ncbi:MAG: phosphate acyltransferase [Flaviaesturariibacter sp.]|nr:phosphate acyltransferase [Flaviaesturariibacter sp.]